MMNLLLFQAGIPDGHAVRQRSLKVATISASMTEVAKGRANLSQLAIQGNYREVAARDMAKVYSRNSARRPIFAAHFARKDSR